MSVQKLTDKQRGEFLEDLRSRFPSAEKGDPYNLASVVELMRALGLRKYQDFTYGNLKALSEYVGRMYFNRRLTLTLQDMAHQVGVDTGKLPDKPSLQVMKFTLESHDQSRVLICELKIFDQRPSLTKDELRIELGDLYKGRQPAVTMHYHSKKNRRWSCPGCGSRRCYRTRSNVDVSISEAYEREGIEGVWKSLDKAWIDLVAIRPPTRALSQRAFWVRWYMHSTEPVKVITPDGPYIGDFADTLINTERFGGIRLQTERWEPLGNSSERQDIPVEKILDILPVRKDYDRVWGVPAYYG